ncbi:hypothetical protein [Arcticibacterium luteifluviistationis]|uniref:Uncharacterized protein n=1 Tax=Arcticibacterium luteifluviistationis TaxID=1784714 RepID=A0A2Z4G781_9BACT|nr:hypothetical protein [Arcticibacterium luteifluviistationis]AWV97021.1 hypothetical protein DJ013_02045 [Arcticibacterium luteifluviistationis]
MFVGHYAAAFALKGKEKSASLGMLFIATQFVDILFFPFTLLGIERLNLVENFTAVNNFDLEYMPFTHGLLGSFLWSAVFYALYYFIFAKNKADKKSIALVMGLGVMSHWFADLLVHTPDLPIINGDPKLGFGLWQYKGLTFALEAVLLIISLVYYLKKTTAKSGVGKYAAIGFVGFLLLVNFLNFYVLPSDDNLVSVAISALLAYFVLAGIAFWVDTKRT